MDSEAVKASRRILRRVQDHLYHAHVNLGGLQETVGLVDVLHHPTSSLASLNYVTPRRNTAWVSADMIEQGLEYIRGIHRTPRVQYIEGLFPPLFSKNMLDLGLQAEWELPLMIYVVGGFNGMTPPPLQTDVLPEEVTIEAVNDQRGLELWWYIWRNAFYDVMTLGVEPLFVGRDMAALTMGYQVDIMAYRGGFPVGVSRLSIHDQTAHILALALMKESRTPEMMRALQSVTIKAALDRQCNLIYAPGETEDDRQLCREMGFLDFGSIVCYSAKPAGDREETEKNEHILGQPVLALR
jgi:hypothetical protein